jgi:hypothetical protein
VDTSPDDSFVVFVRPPPRSAELPQFPEQPIHVCSTYEEAQRFRDRHGNPCNCIIRFVGAAGGGD